MAIVFSQVESDLLNTSKFASRKFDDWNKDIEAKQISVKFDSDLKKLRSFYPEKIARRVAVMDEGTMSPDGLAHEQEKIERLKAKYACVLKEIEFRDKKLVTRTPHHTVYYIDLFGGNNGNDGLSTGKAWQTLEKYTTTTVRTAGDIAYVRANTSEIPAGDIVFDEDGTADALIYIIGCDAVTNDPWNDESDDKPIIDFNEANYQLILQGDNFWQFERLDFRKSYDPSGLVYVYSVSEGAVFINCVFRDNVTNNVKGIYVYDRSTAYLEGCSFTDCCGDSVYANRSEIRLKDCTIDAGSVQGSLYALSSAGLIYAEDCSICPANAFTSAEILVGSGCVANLRNVTFGVSETYTMRPGGRLFSEDHDGVFEAQKAVFYMGNITRGTTLPRSGGADSYAILASNANCGPNQPLILGDKLTGFARIWLAANAASTITVYARVDSAWDSALAANEAYMVISYLDSDSDCGRTLIQSTEQISNSLAGDGKGVWTAFTATIPANNPKRDGWVYVWFCLAEYEDATELVHVDIKPIVS